MPKKKKHYKLDEARFRYLTKVYGYTTLAYVASIFQWILVREIKPVLTWFDEYPMIAIFFWLPALIIIFVITHFTEVRQKFIVNWVLFGLAVETLTVGWAFSLLRGTEFMFILLFFIITCFIIFLVLIAHFIKPDLTKATIIMFAIMVILFIIVIIFIILNVIYEEIFWIKIIFCVISLVLIAMIQLYSAQISQGGRYLELRTSELVMPVVITYLDAIISFILIYMIIEVSVME